MNNSNPNRSGLEYLKTYSYWNLYRENLGMNILSLVHKLLNKNVSPSVYSFSLGTKSTFWESLIIWNEQKMRGVIQRDVTMRLVFCDEYCEEFRWLIDTFANLPGIKNASIKNSREQYPAFEKIRGLLGVESAMDKEFFPNLLQLTLTIERRQGESYTDGLLSEILVQIGDFWIEKGALVERKIGFISNNQVGWAGKIPEYIPIEPEMSEDPRGSDWVDNVRQTISLDVARHIAGYPIEATVEEFAPNFSNKKEFNDSMQKIASGLLAESFMIDDSEDDTYNTLGKLMLTYLPLEICEEIIHQKCNSSYILNTCNKGIDSVSIYADIISKRTDGSREVQIVAYTNRNRVEELISAVKLLEESVSGTISKDLMFDALVIEGIDPDEQSLFNELNPQERAYALKKENESAHFNISIVLHPGQGFSLREIIHVTILALNAAGFKLTGDGFWFLKTGNNEDGHFQTFIHELAQSRSILRATDSE